MPLPVNTKTFQARLVWRSSVAPRPASNSLYFFDIPGGQTEADLYAGLNASVTATMWNNCANSAQVTDVYITPLDGVTAGTNFSTGAPAKWSGSGGSDVILQGAEVVTVRTSLRGPRGRGRVYLPFIGEAQQSNGTLDATAVAAAQTAWNSFYVAMVAAGWRPSLADPFSSTSTDATQYVVRPYLKTQRRRARR